MTESTTTDTSRLRRVGAYRYFLRYLYPHWALIFLTFFLLTGAVLMDVIAPWAIKFIFDSVIAGHPMPGALGRLARAWAGNNRVTLLDLILAAYLGIAALDGIFNYTGVLLLSWVGQRFVFDVRRDLFAHVQKLSLSYHESRRTGDVTTRLTADMTDLQDMVVTASATMFASIMTIALMAAIIARLDWRYMAFTVAVVPLLYLAMRYYQRAIKRESRLVRASEGQLSSIVQEVVSSIRIVKAFTREDFEQQRFEKQGRVSVAANLRAANLQAQYPPVVEMLANIAAVAILALGVREVLSGRLTAGDLLVIVMYFRWMFGPLRQLARVSTVIGRGVASAERVQEVLAGTPDVADVPGARSAPRLRGHIRFEHVSFGYQPDQLVLKDVSFDVEPGSVTALVGATGSGKTTAISLIPRFYDPGEGAIRIDGEDVRNFNLKSLRSQISIVLQEAVLFHGTIFDNIAYGRSDASAAEVYAAARAANAVEFIERLPEKYDTIIGERGETLSGGQRQRISIARAIVRDTRILILDEPTVGLDGETEALVLEALQRLMAHRTTLVIAHHLSTVQHADNIVVLDHGEVVETGKHDELLRKNLWYARVYRTQIKTLTGSLEAAASMYE